MVRNSSDSGGEGDEIDDGEEAEEGLGRMEGGCDGVI